MCWSPLLVVVVDQRQVKGVSGSYWMWLVEADVGQCEIIALTADTSFELLNPVADTTKLRKVSPFDTTEDSGVD